MPFIVKLIISLVAGGVAFLAFAPYDYYWLIFPSLAIFFAQILNSKKPYQAFLLGYAYGFGYFGIGVNWLHISINLFGGVNIIGAYIATYALVAFISLYPALATYLYRRLFTARSKPALFIIAPALWVLMEWCRSWIFTGFPWLNLGYSQTDSILSAYAPLLGVYGISFFIAMIAICLVMLIKADIKTKLSSIVITGLIFFAAHLLQDVQWTEKKEKQLNVALVQGGVPQELKWQAEQRQKTVDLYVGLSQQYWGYDLIVWPETAMPFLFNHAQNLAESLDNRATQTDTSLFIGFLYREDDGRFFNSLIALGPTKGIYHKQHLVPFGEYLPLDDTLRPILNRLNIKMSDISKGDKVRPLLQVGDELAGVSICYEDVFGEEVIQALPEASFLVNVSNDAWFW